MGYLVCSWLYLFPSPLGVAYFQIFKMKTSKEMMMESFVSVPSRGILFPNKNCYIMIESGAKTVSVPSRGILFPNSTVLSFIIACYMFPSPLGVSYFQIMKRQLSGEIKVMFPSPLGVSYFQMSFKHAILRIWLAFPSPLGVSYFQI